MTRRMRSVLLVLALVLSASLLYAADETWTGVISDSHCNAMHAKASKAAETCVEKCIKGGNSYVFVNGADSKVFKLDPADKAKGHGGHEVKVTGTVEGDTIHVKSIEAAGKM
jgi:Protein of unknown function (DUF5818)